MFASNSPSLSDIAAVTGNNRSNSGWGDGDGWWVLVILFALFGGWGRNGAFGGFGGGSGSDAACATAGDLQRGFDNQGVTNKLNGLENGLSQLGYDQLAQMNAINANIANSGYQVQTAINGLSSQLANCCCETREAIQDKNAQIAQPESQVQALNLAQSQANQNSYLLQQLRPCPIPAYTVPNPCAAACYSTYQSCGC